MNRCAWVNLKNPVYVDYHDNEWGRAPASDREYFELLILEGFQAGLSWECVLNKREAFRKAFEGFVPERIAGWGEENILRLMGDPGIIRNRRKISAAIGNARVFLEIVREYGSFESFLLGFTDGKTVTEDYRERTTSPLSDAVSAELKRRGMKFVGSTIIYSYLQATGIINAHGGECDLCPNNKTKG